jgi:copper(I)-binding protein
MKIRLSAAFAAMFLAVPGVSAEVSVTEAWARASVPLQRSTGAFMKIMSSRDARLVELHSPVAGTVEIHEMRMEGELMRMRAIPELKLPAGTVVELKPGAHHVMLIDLKTQAKEGGALPLSLIVEEEDGERRTIEVELAVRPSHGGPPRADGSTHAQ